MMPPLTTRTSIYAILLVGALRVYALPADETCSQDPFYEHGYPSFMTVTPNGQPAPMCKSSFSGQGSFTTIEEMTDGCSTFCPTDSLSVLMGSTTFGLDFNEAAEIYGRLMDQSSNGTTNGLKGFDDTEYRTCLTNRDAFLTIQTLSAKFVGQELAFKRATLKFRTEIQQMIKHAMEDMNSKATVEEMQKVDPNELAGYLISKYKTYLQTLSDWKQQDMIKKLESIKDSSHELVNGFKNAILQMESFVSGCTEKFWPRQDFIILMDLCTKQGSPCFDHEGTTHVSCGCLVDLATSIGQAPTPPPTPTTAPTPAPTYYRRELSSETQDDSFIDICAEGRQLSSAYTESVRKYLADQTPPSKLLDEYDAQLEKKYGDYYCGGSTSSRRHAQNEQHSEAQQFASVDDLPHQDDADERPKEARRAPTPPPTTLKCHVNPFQKAGYPSFFSMGMADGKPSTQWPGYCDEGQFSSMQSMTDKCQELCDSSSESAIPLVLGSTNYGLDFKTCANIISSIMRPESPAALMNFNKQDLDSCLSNKQSFNKITASFTSIIKQVYEFNAAVLLYRSGLKTASKTVSEALVSDKIQAQIKVQFN